MGKPVTVDSDDLEKILMSTGMIKTIEQVIKQSKGDPFVCKDATVLQDAHDNVSKAWRNSIREICHPQQDDPLSALAYALLCELQGKICHIDPAVMKDEKSGFPELFVKLMIEYGTCYQIVYWGGSGKQERIDSLGRTMVRLTPRGQNVLIDMATKGKSSIN